MILTTNGEKGQAITRWLLLDVILLLGMSAARGESLQIIYNTPLDEEEKNARAFIQEEGITQTVSKLLNREFELTSDVSLYLGGSKIPAFDTASSEIQMPYSFVFDIAERFKRDSYSETGADIYDVTRDAYLHALLHQVSHILFVMYDLKTSGSMEKAVDALTILLLLEYYENGGDIVLNAAELFVDETGSGRGRRDFWTTHQFDQQSYNQSLCLVYGSNPGQYARLRGGSEFLQIRGQECIQEYKRQNAAWFRVLGSFMRRPPPG